MNDEKIAEELLAETRTPQEAYEYAIRREKGVEHSKTMKLNPIGTTSSVAIKQEQVGYIQPKGRRGGFSSPFENNRGKYSRGRQNQNTRGNQNKNTQNYASKKTMHKNGNPFSPNHFQSCPARDKVCTKCPKRAHFAKVCRSNHVNFLQNNADNESRDKKESHHQRNEVNDPVAFADFTSQYSWE